MLKPSKLFNLKNPIHFLALGCGSGLMPIAPGTAGSLMAILFFIPLAKLNLSLYILITLLCSIFGCYICGKASSDAKVHDHGAIVFDEFVGMFITLLPIIILNLDSTSFIYLGSGFIIFRFFDMLKPWPISYFDKNIAGGIGIMLDDIIAGIIAAIVLTLEIKYIL